MKREGLIALCEAATVPEKRWLNRDSYRAQVQVGECWALLRAGCEYKIHGENDDPPGTDLTIWVTTYGKGFEYVDWGGDLTEELYYLPTQKRLDEAEGGDWY